MYVPSSLPCPPSTNVSARFSVQGAPSDALAFSNCLIVNPSDFAQGQHVLVKQSFPLTIRCVSTSSAQSHMSNTNVEYSHDNTGKVPQGSIGASATQRQWIGLSLSGDSVTVEPFPQPPPYLESIDIEIGFMKRGLEIAEAFSADEMAQNFLRGFSGTVFATGEILLFEFHGQTLKATVKGVQVVELPNQRSMGNTFGVIMEKTDVTFMKDPSSALKLKSSAKKYPWSLHSTMHSP